MHKWGWSNQGWREVIAADSKKKILERRDALLAEHGDNTEIVHTLSDGSTLRKLTTQGDHDYESDMQGNCVRDHAHDGNIHSLRDKDNVPILSMALETSKRTADCRKCEGEGTYWEDGHWNDDEQGGYQEAGRWRECDRCRGNSVDPEGINDGVVRAHTILRKENDEPKPHELVHLIQGLKEKYSPTHSALSVEHGKNRTWDEMDQAIGKASEVESHLPKGDVYVSIPEHRFEKDDEGNVSADHFAGGTAVSWSREDPGESPGNHVLKTPFTPRRFKYETGLKNYLMRGEDMKEDPEVWVSRDASFPPNAHTMVHAPKRPTKLWLATDPKARSNPAYYRPEGMNTGMVMNRAMLQQPGHIFHDGDKAVSVEQHDLWEVNFKDEDEARKFTSVNQYGHDTLHVNKDYKEQCPTCEGERKVPDRSRPEPDTFGRPHVLSCPTCKATGQVTKPYVIPWDRAKLVRPADESKVQAEPMPTFHGNDDGTVRAEVHEPKFLHIKSDIFRDGTKNSWQALHDLEHTGLSQKDWNHRTLDSYEGWSGVKPSLDDWRGSENAVITIPNDPKYVEPEQESETGSRSSKMSRSYRLREGVTIPRSQYTLEHKQEGSLAPTHAYLHIQHTERDNEDVFTDKGINTKPLTDTNTSYRSSPNKYKITTTPNGDSPGHWKRNHPFSPQEADIFKLDLSKMPKWNVSNERTNHEYAEADAPNVTRVTPNSTATDPEWEPCEDCDAHGYVDGKPCTNCGGNGKQLRGANPHLIPWEAVVGLHSKAEVQPAEEYRKRFAYIRMQSRGWGDIRARRVRA